MFCSSLVASFSEQSLGDKDTDPEERVEDLLLSSEPESKATDSAMLLDLPSPVLLATLGRAVVRRLLLSGRGTGME